MDSSKVTLQRRCSSFRKYEPTTKSSYMSYRIMPVSTWLNHVNLAVRPHKKTKLFLVPSLLTFGCRITFFFFFLQKC